MARCQKLVLTVLTFTVTGASAKLFLYSLVLHQYSDKPLKDRSKINPEDFLIPIA